MTDLEELREAIVAFTRERDWDQFHDGKNLAIALSLEASELLETFLWKDAQDAKVDKIKEELADVVNYAILIADKYNLDIKQINTLWKKPGDPQRNTTSYSYAIHNQVIRISRCGSKCCSSIPRHKLACCISYPQR